MCIIIAKPAGVEMPAQKILIRSAALNPDGFGFCTRGRLYKSLNFDAFLKNASRIKVENPAILHFRFATNGSIKRANCHPFAHKGIYFAHNGALNIETQGDMTDSETFFATKVMRAISEYGYGSQFFDYYLNAQARNGCSRFALMREGEISLYGQFVEYEGCYYSNARIFNNLIHI
jgi:predicted glutamine amidotransferase